MADWYETRTLNRSTKALIAVAVLAVVLVAALPLAFIIALFLMLFGHVAAGLILIGASVLAAGSAVGLAAFSGVRKLRHLREILTSSMNDMTRHHAEHVLILDSDEYDAC
jgi:ABC-type transport system involved in multi-copper enzyme maturation permease subunit